MSDDYLKTRSQWSPNWGSVIVSTLICLCLLTLQQVLAHPPTAASTVNSSLLTINYQGRLTQPNGLPLNQSQDITFRLYTTPTGGSAVWQEAWVSPQAVTVVDGLFSVLLGTHNPTLTSIIPAHQELWLGVTVGSDPEMTPRTQFGSVPFAVQALTVPDGSITSEKLNLTNGLMVTGNITFTGILTGPHAYWADYRSFIRFLAQDGVTDADLCPEGGIPAGVTGPLQSLELQTGDDIAAIFVPDTNATCINVHTIQPCGSIIGNFYPYAAESCTEDFSGQWAPFYWSNGETTHYATSGILDSGTGCYPVKYACVQP